MKWNPDDLHIESWPLRPDGGMIAEGMPRGIKITHIPTGLVATCDTERSQHLNRQRALADLEQQLEARQRRDED